MSERRLAAIMFTDIVGYTALMGSDEVHAFEVLKKNRKIHNQCIETFHGTLIKEMGDGMLISFNLATDAVRCAIEIQKASKKQNIPLRIGIHEGEMVFEGADVLGDGVNIASRLEQSAKKGGIAISGTIYGDIKNKTDIQVRFIGEKTFKNVSEPLKVYEVSCEKNPSEKQGANFSGTIRERGKSFIRHKIVKIAMGLVPALAIAFVIIFLFYRGRSVPFAERDWIVISDFENLTDEAIFDHSLNTAFALSINQSRYINVFTHQRMKETLKRMKETGLESIDEKTAREIAVRDGIKFCIVPGISKVGNQYILTAKIVDASTGDIYNSEILYAKSQAEILEKLDLLSNKVRRHLGETRYEIFEQSKPLTQATTSSLEALKQFSLGIGYHKDMKFEEAKAHYEQAIALDSNFTSAKASLGNLLFEKFDRKEGRKWLDEAIVSIDDLTDREKYGILAFYAVNIKQDLDLGIEYTKMLIELYPDDPIPHNNLGWYLYKQGYYKKGVEEYKTALRLDPYMLLTFGGVIYTYLVNVWQIDSAKTWTMRMIKYGPDNPWGYFYLGSIFVAEDSLEKAEKAFQKAKELKPDFILNQYRLAHVERLQGKYDKAIEVLKDISQINPGETSVLYDMGVNYQLSGDLKSADDHYRAFLKVTEVWLKKYPEVPDTYLSRGVALTKLGKKEEGWTVGIHAIELDSTIHFRFAQLLAVQGRKDEALSELEKALANGYRNLAWIKLHPDLQSLHDDAGYRGLIRKYFGQE